MEIEGFEILEKIGQGGMAQVYKGYQTSLKRPVAIKVLTHKFADHPDFIQRFEKESIIIARLSHPFIIPVIERGISNNELPYFIMEFVEGNELGKIMGKGELNLNRKLEIIVQVCKALSYAHRNKVIHRDIKPANIFIDSEGNARILDFGIAQYYEDEAQQEIEQTKAGTIMGTMAYMSPEQRRSATDVTFKSDLYSLGVLMYKIFTHQDPVGRFKAPDELNPEVPYELSQIILKCLETSPEDRPDSSDEIKDVLLLLLRGSHLQTEQRERVQNDFKQFDLLDVIKEDNHSSVMLFQNRSNNNLIVIKKRAANTAGFEEAKLLTPLKHPNLVNILGTSENKRFYIIVMEYLNGGNLKDRLVQPMKWQDFIPMAKQIASAMSFAHNNRIIHGNLRPSNILFDAHDQIKLADFGLEEHYVTNKQKHNWYRLPKEKSSAKFDIFSAGVIFYEMLIGTVPVLDDNRFETNITFRRLPVKLKELIIQMLCTNPLERIGSFSLVEDQLDEVVNEANATMVTTRRRNKKKKRKPQYSRYITYTVLTILIITGIILLISNFESISYFVEDFFNPQTEEQQPMNFIEFN